MDILQAIKDSLKGKLKATDLAYLMGQGPEVRLGLTQTGIFLYPFYKSIQKDGISLWN